VVSAANGRSDQRARNAVAAALTLCLSACAGIASVLAAEGPAPHTQQPATRSDASAAVATATKDANPEATASQSPPPKAEAATPSPGIET